MNNAKDKHPEHQKLIAIKDESQAIGEFIEWLGQQGIHLCSIPPYYQSTYAPVSESIGNMLARFFEIDLDKIEQEKRAMLEELRVMNQNQGHRNDRHGRPIHTCGDRPPTLPCRACESQRV